MGSILDPAALGALAAVLPPASGAAVEVEHLDALPPGERARWRAEVLRVAPGATMKEPEQLVASDWRAAGIAASAGPQALATLLGGLVVRALRIVTAADRALAADLGALRARRVELAAAAAAPLAATALAAWSARRLALGAFPDPGEVGRCGRRSAPSVH